VLLFNFSLTIGPLYENSLPGSIKILLRQKMEAVFDQIRNAEKRVVRAEEG